MNESEFYSTCEELSKLSTESKHICSKLRTLAKKNSFLLPSSFTLKGKCNPDLLINILEKLNYFEDHDCFISDLHVIYRETDNTTAVALGKFRLLSP